ncbi:MAG: pyruvate dehydrogenase (acetyl-transferring), homodimeric type, partial [Planctomycetota bacterium]|nr:pyruvate dehydrogenase (acetyl-transferring), homodimeric type [Planctomycetota bacterium]
MCEQQPSVQDVDPQETEEWLDALDDLRARWGEGRVFYMLGQLQERAALRGCPSPIPITPPVNSIPPEEQAPYPGDLALERRLESYLRWNAIAMVMRANQANPGLGGHLATYASLATVFEVGFNHFFRGRSATSTGDQIFFQGHASPGIYARAFLEGRLSERDLDHFRQELAPGGGLSSYPHPWLMPDFWQFPTVSMGLAAISAIYQARFNRYLEHRGLRDTSGSRVWLFCGDGEMDEPESLGALTVASRERLDNLTMIVNCNLQRLDGPVRGNGSIVRELEGVFRGAGWNVIKVMWSSEWDELFAADPDGNLARRLAATVDGELQKLGVEPIAALRQHLFAGSPELEALGARFDDAFLARLRRGGHDALKVHAAFKEAVEHRGEPTVILCHTVKGFGLGTGEGKNTAHQQKSLKTEDIANFIERFDLDVSRENLEPMRYLHPGQDSEEVRYLKARREALGGPVPRRVVDSPALEPPALADLGAFTRDSEGREVSTTMAFVRLLSHLLKDKGLGKLVVPIVPDEARTFGMEALFNQFGIYSWQGQLYEPVDRKTVMYYKEARDGQLLQEGITEAGGLCSWIAAGTAYATHGVPTIPFFIFYSMFGFQRVMDLIWSGADARVRGFLMGATAGRTTLNGEGLQHEDGHGLLLAAAVPTCHAYDPAYAYEVTVIVQDGLRRMYRDGEPGFYYITLFNENYAQPAMPEGAADGIVRGLYLLRPGQGDAPRAGRPQLFGSGTIMNEVLRAQALLQERWGVTADVWSVTSYTELARDARAAARAR